MRLPNNILLVAALCVSSLTAGEWKLDGEGLEFDSKQGRARAVGPLKFEWGDWVILASTEALVSSNAKIHKRLEAGDGARYAVGSKPAKIVFLGNCRLLNKRGKEILTGTYLILDLADGTVTSKGAGLQVLTESGVRVSGIEECHALVSLVSGSVTLSEAGWIEAKRAD